MCLACRQLRPVGAGYFQAGTNLSVADEWRERMEDLFQSLRCPDQYWELNAEFSRLVVYTGRALESESTQEKYALEVLKHFNMEKCNVVYNPMVPRSKLDVDEEGEKVDDTLYKQIIGSLMYLTTTRPNMQFTISLLSRYMAKPTQLHLQAAKRVLRNLRGTMDYGIWYKQEGTGEVWVYTASNFAGDADSRKSTSDEAVVAWLSKKQPIITLFTTEAEYVTTSVCACQAIWFKRVFKEVEYGEESTIIMYENTSTIKLSKYPVFY
ncbi:PREDICTED: uncharacterized protein LOC109128681 [Camelina sativa]|uniref:Uncharacterized protein LOC109128681 n=1 Tax=Camelina sativa TaxID=90675 RepID=A0ABM1QWD2_CAMSA|nr:PREDICTED: uncharacterized protein LOC109128681 [Camelina sativa]